MDLSCFLASSPYAEDAYQLYSEDNDNGNLWERTNQSAPLPTCSSPDAPDHRCDVCRRDGHVYAFCRHLLDKLKLVMETTGGDPITLREIDCPVFLPDSPEQQPHFPTGLVIFIVVAVLLLLLIVIGFVFYRKHRKHRKHQNKHRSVPSDDGSPAVAAGAEDAV